MKKFALSLVALAGFSVVTVGCGGHDQKVVQPPAADEPEVAPGDQADYDKQMAEQMKKQGN